MRRATRITTENIPQAQWKLPNDTIRYDANDNSGYETVWADIDDDRIWEKMGYQYIYMDLLSRYTREEYLEEIRLNIMTSPNPAYIASHKNLYDELCILNNWLKSLKFQMDEANNQLNDWLKTASDEQIQKKIEKYIEVELLFNIAGGTNAKLLIDIPIYFILPDGNHLSGKVKNILPAKDRLRDSYVVINIESIGEITVNPLAFIVENASKFPKTIPEVKEYQLTQALKTIDSARNSKVISLENGIREYRERITNLQRDIERYKDALAFNEKELGNKKIVKTTRSELRGLLKQIKEHSSVKKAYITSDGEIAVITKNLLYIENGKPNPKKALGQFLIKLDIKTNNIRVFNMTYGLYAHYDHDEERNRFDGENVSHYHMNIINNGSVCWGDHQSDVINLLKSFEVYLLIDFIVEFLAVEHDDESDPYYSASIFLKEKLPLKEPFKLPESIL